MSRLARYVATELGLAALGGLAVAALALPHEVWRAAAGGLAAAFGCGVWALWLKSLARSAEPSEGSAAELRRLLSGQALVFGLRLAAALLGALVARRLQFDALAYVAGFALLTLVLMVVEVRYVLGSFSGSTAPGAPVGQWEGGR